MITARGNWHYVFDMEGRLISKNSYLPKSYDSFPEKGESVVVPTAPWLWIFSNPFISWAVGAMGMVLLIVMHRQRHRHRQRGRT